MIVFHNAVLITMDSKRRMFPDGALVVKGSKIQDVGPSEAMLARYPMAKRTDCNGGILMPGLINTHVHLAQCMMRGSADDLELMPWLEDHIWPVLAGYTPETFLVSARLNMAEMLLSGTTTFVDPMFAGHYGMEQTVKAVEDCGIRGCIAKIVMDKEGLDSRLPPILMESRVSSFGQAVDAFEQYHNAADGRVQIWLAPRWTSLFDSRLLPQVSQYMDNYGMRTTIHYAESRQDVDAIRSATGFSPAEYLYETGLARKQTLLVHCTAIPNNDDVILGASGVSIAYCPTSTMKTVMGICRAADFIDAGINVTLGTDAAACNNNSDLFLEMRYGALVQKQYRVDATVLPSNKMLEMATIDGAKALGLDEKIGSLERGKQADFIIVDINKPRLQPMQYPPSTIAYAATGHDVSTVVVQGRTLVHQGKLLTIDVDEVIGEAKRLMTQAWVGTHP